MQGVPGLARPLGGRGADRGWMGCPSPPLAALPSSVPSDGCAYCLVFYGDREEYLLLTLVFARQLAIHDRAHPLLVLPTVDVPEPFLEVLRRAGCLVQPAVDYLCMHPSLLRSPTGRHRRVLTKLQALGVAGLRKVILVDADLFPRAPLGHLFARQAPAATLMPANLLHASVLEPGSLVPRQWLEVDKVSGVGGRINAGMVLLEPDPGLLDYIVSEVSPQRRLDLVDGVGAVRGVFGGSWRPSWTPEEDALTRAVHTRNPDARWVQL